MPCSAMPLLIVFLKDARTRGCIVCCKSPVNCSNKKKKMQLEYSGACDVMFGCSCFSRQSAVTPTQRSCLCATSLMSVCLETLSSDCSTITVPTSRSNGNCQFVSSCPRASVKSLLSFCLATAALLPAGTTAGWQKHKPFNLFVYFLVY